MKSAETEESKVENEGCLAVVPWVPSQIASVESRDSEQQVPALMETDEMDVEENCSNNGSMQEEHGYGLDGLKPREALHNWAQQQHCMLPQPPQNLFTPITWSDWKLGSSGDYSVAFSFCKWFCRVMLGVKKWDGQSLSKMWGGFPLLLACFIQRFWGA